MGAAQVSQFLTALAVDRQVAASTQNQAMNALVFLYRVVLDHDLPWLDDVVRARRPRHLPVVFTRDEVRRVVAQLDGGPRLIALLLYGCGLRPAKPGLLKHIAFVREQHAHDLALRAGWVWLPDALARKYPRAAREIGWQWVFPATRHYVDPLTGQRRRHHLHETVMQRAVRGALRAARITKHANCHTFEPPRVSRRLGYVSTASSAEAAWQL